MDQNYFDFSQLLTYKKVVNQTYSAESTEAIWIKDVRNKLETLVGKLAENINTELVVDAKYKLRYKASHIHDDIRQVAGYARLKKVRDHLGVTDDSNIPCLIIYPNIDGNPKWKLDTLLKLSSPIPAYHKVYKLGVPLQLIKPFVP